jgi:hypothetical protein
MTTKTKTPPAGGNNNPQHEYRSNPEIDAKIDAYIKENPKDWAYIQAMPRERLERTLVLNEVQKLERQQRIREGVMKDIGRNPELQQAYETLVKGVPEDHRETVMAQMATQNRRAVTRSQRAVGQSV